VFANVMYIACHLFAITAAKSDRIWFSRGFRILALHRILRYRRAQLEQLIYCW